MAVLYRGTMAPRVTAFDEVWLRMGVKVHAAPSQRNMAWVVDVDHPQLGKARVDCPKCLRPVDRAMLEIVPELFEDERDAIAACRIGIGITMQAKGDDPLAERKRLLRLAHALAGDDAVAVFDEVAQRVWVPELLDEEMFHDGPLDIEGIISYHAVLAVPEEGERIGWFHTHGLGEIGLLDYDILRPHSSLLSGGREVVRTIAWSIIEGAMQSGATTALARPGGIVLPMDAALFQKRASRADAALRHAPGRTHERNRVVLCEPHAGKLGRWFGTPRPSLWLTQPLDERTIFELSAEVTAAMAQRAQDTIPALARYLQEFADLPIQPIVKLAYKTSLDAGEGREHMWFHVHGLRGDPVDATLASEPCGPFHLKPGDRGMHDLSILSDWCVLGPTGCITPFAGHAARELRREREWILKQLDAVGEPPLSS